MEPRHDVTGDGAVPLGQHREYECIWTHGRIAEVLLKPCEDLPLAELRVVHFDALPLTGEEPRLARTALPTEQPLGLHCLRGGGIAITIPGLAQLDHPFNQSRGILSCFVEPVRFHRDGLHGLTAGSRSQDEAPAGIDGFDHIALPGSIWPIDQSGPQEPVPGGIHHPSPVQMVVRGRFKRQGLAIPERSEVFDGKLDQHENSGCSMQFSQRICRNKG